MATKTEVIVSPNPTTAVVTTVNPETLISQAIDKNVPVETMEKLLAMRRELKAEYAKEQFFIALSTFQRECPIVKKASICKDKDGSVRYRYASMDDIISAVQVILERHGLSYVVKTKQADKTVTAVCEAHHVAGHTEETEFTIPVDPKAYMNEAQKVASALTYAKRYAFCNAFGIMTGDEDDDSGATGVPARTVAPKAAVPTKDYTVVPKTKSGKWDGKKWSEIPEADLSKFAEHYGAQTDDHSNFYLNEIAQEMAKREPNSDSLEGSNALKPDTEADKKAEAGFFDGSGAKEFTDGK